MLRCESTDLSVLVYSVCAVSQKVVEQPSATVSTTLRDKMGGVGQTRSVNVRCCSLRWVDV